jgi:LysR family transcriptional activator of dmlA
MKDHLTIDALRVFSQAARYQSFSQAARMLGISPAYVTKHIKLLETELGARLFHRTTRQVTLTEQGEEVHALALQILQDVERLHDRIAEFKSEPRGTLRISTSMGFGRQVVAPALADFSLRHPAIQVELDLLDHLVNMAKEQYDLDIRIGDTIDPNYIARPLADNHRILCAAPAYLEKHGAPRTLQELLRHNCLIVRERDHPVGVWSLSRKNVVSSVKIQGSLTTNNGEIALAWALAGHGIVLRSLWDVHRHLESGALVHLLPGYLQKAGIYAVFPQRLDNSAKVKVCIDYLQAHFRTATL